MDVGVLLLEGATLTVIVFSALAFFLLRRWFSPANDAMPPGLSLRFIILLFGFSLIALIEGLLLRPYSFFWFVLVVGTTLFIIAKITRSCWAGSN
jgi:hypothetical protein